MKEYVYLIFVFKRAPHWSVRIGYVFMKIDSWDSETAYLKVDSNTVYSKTLALEGISLCGLSAYYEYADTVNVNVTHSASSMTI